MSGSYFDVLGVAFQKGRPFAAAEDDPAGGAHVAVISDRLWASVFNRDPSVLETSIRLNGQPFAVVGVAADGFHGPQRVSDTDIWILRSTTPAVDHLGNVSYNDRRRGGYYEFVARLKPGATWAQAEGELQSLGPWLAQQHPEVNEKYTKVGFHLLGPIGIGPHPGVERLTEAIGRTRAAPRPRASGRWCCGARR